MCGESKEPASVVYRIWDTQRKEYVGSYSRSYHDEFDFPSEQAALNANVHGMFKNPKYEIHKCLREYRRLDL